MTEWVIMQTVLICWMNLSQCPVGEAIGAWFGLVAFQCLWLWLSVPHCVSLAHVGIEALLTASFCLCLAGIVFWYSLGWYRILTWLCIGEELWFISIYLFCVFLPAPLWVISEDRHSSLLTQKINFKLLILHYLPLPPIHHHCLMSFLVEVYAL